MRIHRSKPLFAWDCLEDNPSLQTVRAALAAVRDGKLLGALDQARGRGRNDYPVRVLWGTVLLNVLLRHPTMEATLDELRRNPPLAALIGIEGAEEVPNPWNMTRFLDILGREPFRSLLREMHGDLIGTLAAAVPDLGRETSADSSHLRAKRSAAGDGAEPELPEAAGGRKEYTDESGKVVKVVEWFGFKFHALVDSRHEVALAYAPGPANGADKEMLGELVRQAQANLPGRRIETLAYDKAADDHDSHALLAAAGIRPVIQIRSLWKDEQERLLPGHEGGTNVVHDEAGTIYCYDVTSRVPVRHAMAYIGHEAARGTLKYRCPARHGGWTCPHDAVCNAGKKYGKTVRVKQELDLRRFPPIPRATKAFERLYRGRTSVERFNARLKIFWGIDDGNLAGARRFYAKAGVVMVVHAAMALLLASAPRHAGTLGTTRLRTVAKALLGAARSG